MNSGKVLLLCAFSAASVAYFLPPRDNLTHPVPDILEEGYESCFFECDMILTPEQILNLFSTTKNARIDEKYRWPDATVIYYVSKKFDDDETAMIERAMRAIAKKSCIKFVERTSDDNHYVLFSKVEKGCFSNVGYQHAKQKIGLSPRCFLHYGAVLHEILHTVGFYHMHSAFDRDDYVTIIEDNIKENHVHNFIKYSNAKVTHFGLKYDYNSVMHYGRKAFSKNEEDTIVPVDPDAPIGQRKGLSRGDKMRMNRMYNC